MSTLWKKTLLYLGLVDEEELEGAQVAAPPNQSQVRTVRSQGSSGRDGIPGRRVEPPANARREIASDSSQAEAGVLVRPPGGVRRVPPGEGRADVVVATQFNDAQLVADRIRDRTPVILDLRQTDPDMVRRLVDFVSGLTYALEGTMRKVAQGVILVLPPRVVLSRDERRRLAGLGLYELPPEEEPGADS